jgi:hypothetical protein
MEPEIALVTKRFVVVASPSVALPRVESPETVSEPSVPTEVSEELTTLELSVVPDKVPAGATTAVAPAAVIRPLPFTVKFGTDDAPPKEPVFEFTVARVVTLPVEVTSPVRFALVVTVAALPLIEPSMMFAT